jgi:hypothetical protein
VKLPRCREVISGFATDAEIAPQNAWVITKLASVAG